MEIQRYKILETLKEAGDRGVHSFYFYKNYLPTFSQRIGELVKEGYKIQRINNGNKGATYFLKG